VQKFAEDVGVQKRGTPDDDVHAPHATGTNKQNYVATCMRRVQPSWDFTCANTSPISHERFIYPRAGIYAPGFLAIKRRLLKVMPASGRSFSRSLTSASISMGGLPTVTLAVKYRHLFDYIKRPYKKLTSTDID
jgi:hypothetical protein